jgi:hypothetical protein
MDWKMGGLGNELGYAVEFTFNSLFIFLLLSPCGQHLMAFEFNKS